MTPPRFYAPLAGRAATRVELPDDEATHLTRVLRLSTGDEIRVFDGRGMEWRATIEDASKRGVSVLLTEAVTPAPEPRVAITLALAVLKGDKMDDIVRDAVMLGVRAIRPVISARTEIAAATIARSGRVARWQRIAVSSAKQCGRAVVPRIHDAVPIDGILDGEGSRVMLVEPAADARATPLKDVPPLDCPTLLVGPEGGWTGDEVQRAAAAGTMLMTLGAQTLRADAMPLVALTALRVQWDDF